MYTTNGRWRRRVVLPVALLTLTMASACADDDGGEDAEPADTPTTATVDRPSGPAADLGEELSGGDGVFIGNADPGQLGNGYEELELVASGTATAYTEAGSRTADGRWTFEPGVTADYRTRVIVRRPREAADFNGTVMLEWLNVSGGVDADPEYATLREEVIRSGVVWVGVSAQVLGIEGGPVAVRVDVPGAEDAGKGLKVIDPERYGSLEHPGDAYAYDIYTQVARAVRDGALAGLEPAHVVAAGESQSAFALVTYVNGVQPLTQAFDGFFVHSRGGAGLALPEPGEGADISGSIGGSPAIFRTDTDVPIFNIQTENDVVGVLGSVKARQPDTDLFRLWEVPGTAHADRHLTGETTAEAIDCGLPINDGPFHIVAKAAFRHFVAWVDEGRPPPDKPRIELTAGDTAISRDDDGIALGGVRTPPVDVPTRILSGEKGPSDDVICLLSGSTKPMPAERLAARYDSRADFEAQYADAVDEAIAAGTVLEEDREALEGYAHAELVS
jgi:hypothetical protein